MYQDAVMVAASQNTQYRVKNLRPQDYNLQVSKTGSGFTRRMSNWKNRKWVYPSNIVYLATSQKIKGIVPVFQTIYQAGLSDFSPKKEILFWIHLWGQGLPTL